MALIRQKEWRTMGPIREKMLRYLNRFKLKTKQINYKPRTYANLKGLNLLRAQNVVSVEPAKPIVNERVKARLDCNLNALLANKNDSNKRRIKPQESYINMDLNADPNKTKRKSQRNEVELDAVNAQTEVHHRLPENFRSKFASESLNSDFEFALEPLHSDFHTDFKACFETQIENSMNVQKNRLQNDRKKLTQPKGLRTQPINNDESCEINSLFTHEKANARRNQKAMRDKSSRPSDAFTTHDKSIAWEITNNSLRTLDRSNERFGVIRPVVPVNLIPSFGEHYQSEQRAQNKFRRNDGTFSARQKYPKNEYITSTPTEYFSQRSKNEFVIPIPPSKLSIPSSIRSKNRFTRDHNREVTKKTRTSSIAVSACHDKSLRSKKTDSQTRQRNADTIDTSFQTKPFDRNRNNKFVNPPTRIDSSECNSEYVESWDTMQNAIKAGHGNEPPKLPGISDKVFFVRPIQNERSPSDFSLTFCSSNVTSTFKSNRSICPHVFERSIERKFSIRSNIQDVSVLRYNQNVQQSVFKTRFTHTILRDRNGFEEMIHREFRKSS